jgi:hypothetical protein
MGSAAPLCQAGTIAEIAPSPYIPRTFPIIIDDLDVLRPNWAGEA